MLTMVDRDDLADQGAAHVAATVRNLKERPRFFRTAAFGASLLLLNSGWELC